jgi:hypothetical protein
VLKVEGYVPPYPTEQVSSMSKAFVLYSIYPFLTSLAPLVLLIEAFPDFPQYLQASARKLLM